jgi:hypothetical protein
MKHFKRLLFALLLLGPIFQTTWSNAETTAQTTPYAKVSAVKKLMADNPESFKAGKKSEKDLLPIERLGFEVDKTQGIYYSKVDAWQKEYGYDDLYDKMVPSLDKEKIEFNYDNKDWAIWLWKGYYAPFLGCGSEIGTYIKDPFKKFPVPTKIDYRGANQDEMLTVSYKLKHGDKEVFHFNPQKHWWLAGFKPCDYIPCHELKVEAHIDFLTEQMAEAFENSAKNHASDLTDLKRDCATVDFSWK